jgi:hypothetical protein
LEALVFSSPSVPSLLEEEFASFSKAQVCASLSGAYLLEVEIFSSQFGTPRAACQTHALVDIHENFFVPRACGIHAFGTPREHYTPLDELSHNIFQADSPSFPQIEANAHALTSTVGHVSEVTFASREILSDRDCRDNDSNQNDADVSIEVIVLVEIVVDVVEIVRDDVEIGLFEEIWIDHLSKTFFVEAEIYDDALLYFQEWLSLAIEHDQCSSLAEEGTLEQKILVCRIVTHGCCLQVPHQSDYSFVPS